MCLQGESQMKKRYQIDKQRAVQKFRQFAAEENQPIQLVIPLKEVLDLIQRGLMNVAMAAFTKLAESVMGHEVTALVGEKNRANAARMNNRWGSEPGYCVVGGQKIPLQRPRVRDTRKREVPLGSYELLQRASLMEESVWQKMMHGITTRRYNAVVKELEQAYGIQKSTISEHFIEASRERLDKLLARPLREYAFCAMMIDGTNFDDQQLITVLGITVHGQKLVLGLRQGATENTTVVKQAIGRVAGARRGFRSSTAVCLRWWQGALGRGPADRWEGRVHPTLSSPQGPKRGRSPHRGAPGARPAKAAQCLRDARVYRCPTSVAASPPRIDGFESERCPKSGRRSGRHPHGSPLACAAATTDQLGEHQPDRICLLHRGDRVPQCEALAGRRSTSPLGCQRLVMGRVQMESSAWLS